MRRLGEHSLTDLLHVLLPVFVVVDRAGFHQLVVFFGAPAGMRRGAEGHQHQPGDEDNEGNSAAHNLLRTAVMFCHSLQQQRQCRCCSLDNVQTKRFRMGPDKQQSYLVSLYSLLAGALLRLPKRRRKRSTRPAVSIIFCLPV